MRPSRLDALGPCPAACTPVQVAATEALPPPAGPATPRVAPIKEADGLYTQSWFQLSFLDLREDFNEAKAAGKRFAVVFEQRGCPYCIKMHNEILSRRYINDYVRQNFHIVQLDLWGAREVTDFDGRNMSEKDLAERWGVIFTPTVVFYKDDLTGLDGKWGRELEAIERLPLSYGQRHVLRPVRLGAPQALRARQELPALPHLPHRRAGGAEG